MREISTAKTSIAAFLVTLTLSAVTMLWFFWHFPVTTAVITLAVLAAFAISARGARSIEVEKTELEPNEQRAR